MHVGQQHLWSIHGRFDGLLCDVHAIRARRHTEELSPLRMPLCQFQCAVNTRVPLVRLLVVCIHFSLSLYVGWRWQKHTDGVGCSEQEMEMEIQSLGNTRG